MNLTLLSFRSIGTHFNKQDIQAMLSITLVTIMGQPYPEGKRSYQSQRISLIEGTRCFIERGVQHLINDEGIALRGEDGWKGFLIGGRSGSCQRIFPPSRRNLQVLVRN